MLRMIVDGSASGVMRREFRGLSLWEEWWLNTFAGLAAFLFCGIHLATWNFSFPTDAEAIAWLVFSLVALATPVIIYLVSQAALVARWLKGRGVPLPSFLDGFPEPQGKFYMFEI